MHPALQVKIVIEIVVKAFLEKSPSYHQTNLMCFHDQSTTAKNVFNIEQGF